MGVWVGPKKEVHVLTHVCHCHGATRWKSFLLSIVTPSPHYSTLLTFCIPINNKSYNLIKAMLQTGPTSTMEIFHIEILVVLASLPTLREPN